VTGRRTTQGTDVGPRIAVIGAGFGGIAAGIALDRAGLGNFTILEKSTSVGGTWHANRYPGAATDAPAHLYSFSFRPHDWSRTHVGQAELLEYLDATVDDLDLRRRLQLGVTVACVEWLDDEHRYRVVLGDGREERFDAVISAVGMFARPRLPGWPGLRRFDGPVLHTAAWDASVSLAGRRVAVVGTGSSAAQVVPAVAPVAEEVVLFQRQPGWLLPKGDRDYSRRERRLYRLRSLQKLDRLRLHARHEFREWRGAMFRPGSLTNRRLKAQALAYLDEVFAGRPDLRAAVTPDYEFAGKRTLVSSDFYPALTLENVTLVPRAVASCTPTGLVDVAGEEHPIDVLVLATGFEATRYLDGLEVRGRGGLRLHDLWGDEAYAFLGLLVPGFPNFFLLYGPNTNGGLIVTNLERQARFAAGQIAWSWRHAVPVEVGVEVTDRYNGWLQRRIARMAFSTAENYFRTSSGRVVTQWPDSASAYGLVLAAAARLRRWWARPAGGPTTGGIRRRPSAARSAR
jgi:cation diffusion facilitator CzcD-associated flavoprotein CzcO